MAETTTIARPYAQAVFALASEQGNLQGWSDMMQLVATIVGDAQVAALLESPDVSDDQVCDLILDICGDKLNDTGKNMVRVLAENGRLAVMPEIAELYEVERAKAEGNVEADVVSAVELNDAQKKSIAEALSKRLGRNVTLKCSTDAALVGGVVIRAGDMVIDGSVVSKLSKLGASLMH